MVIIVIIITTPLNQDLTIIWTIKKTIVRLQENTINLLWPPQVVLLKITKILIQVHPNLKLKGNSLIRIIKILLF